LGTPAFLCPEVARAYPHFDGIKADVWAAGVTLWNMTTGTYPFHGDSLFALYEAIGSGERGDGLLVFPTHRGGPQAISAECRGV
jgi:serine/threonine protein kinase